MRREDSPGPSSAGRARPSEEVWVFEGVAPPTPAGRGRRTTAPPMQRTGGVPGGGEGRGGGGRPPPTEAELPADVVAELAGAVGRPKAQKVAQRMASAAHAYERDRYPEALRMTRQLVSEVPESAAVQELHGLVCYRSGRWREAAKHLSAARGLSGDDPSQLPAVMDCERAMGHHRRVEALWEELRASSPPADVLVEGRLVLAAGMAERGRIDDAIALLATAGGARNLRHPGDRHLRQWYVLADLYERAGDVPRARELFARVASVDPELADVTDRLAALGRPRRPARRGTARTSR